MLLAGNHPVTITPDVAVLDRYVNGRSTPPQAAALASSAVTCPQAEFLPAL